MCHLEDLRLSIAGGDEIPTKRILERWISKIPWLKSSQSTCPGRFRIGSPKKTQSCLVCATAPSSYYQWQSALQEFNVLVAEDGKGAKRWCLLADEQIPISLAELTLLAAGKPTMFFPSGSLVVTCREINRREQNPGAGIDVGTSQFPEPNTSNDDYLPETKTMAKT